MPKISIHLVTWNGQQYLKQCLDSVLAQTLTDYLLIIIDNGSADETLRIIEQDYLPIFGDKARLIKNKENVGFAKAHNQALLWTDSDYVLMLNQDVILDPDFLQKTTEFLDQNSKTGSVTGKILRWKFEQEQELNNLVKSDIIDSLGLKIFKSQRVVERGSGKKDTGQYNKIKEIFGVSGACPVFRRQALNDIRYQDEFLDNDFFSYKEDIDLAYRLQWRGWQSFYLPQAVAFHKRTARAKDKKYSLDILKQRQYKGKFINYHSYKNHLFFLKKNVSNRIFRKYFFPIFFYELKKFLYVLFLEWPTLAALKEYRAKKKLILEKRKYIMDNRLATDEEIIKWFK